MDPSLLAEFRSLDAMHEPFIGAPILSSLRCLLHPLSSLSVSDRNTFSNIFDSIGTMLDDHLDREGYKQTSQPEFAIGSMSSFLSTSITVGQLRAFYLALLSPTLEFDRNTNKFVQLKGYFVSRIHPKARALHEKFKAFKQDEVYTGRCLFLLLFRIIVN